ncbi:MAG: hypothetical protein EHM58_14305 [Ignavibacteriae bacterium]|nr:MAG: hypothetical protein EHM58_14305 [Ignavibacteriota bacterium]
MKTITFIIIAFIMTGAVQAGTGVKTLSPSAVLDLEKFARQVYDIYQTDEVAAKKERLVNKKLSELIGQTYTMKVTTTDSIRYDKKEDKTSIKSKEIYYSDNQKGYMGIFVIFEKKGDELLMTSSPDKDMTINGKVNDVIITGYFKNDMFNKVYTSLKDFDDSGTTIQQIILRVEI